jgi:hypothetical protein
MPGNQEPMFGTSFWLIVLVATACGFEMALLLYTMGEHALGAAGQEAHGFWVGEHAPVRDVLEVGAFIGTFLLFAVAGVALIVTRNQLRDAEKARLANVYLQISAAWSLPRVVASRMYMLTLRDNYRDPTYQDADKSVAKTAPEYVKLVLLALRQTDRLGHHRRTFILTFLEDLAVLCKNDYVKDRVIFDFIGAPIVTQMELLEDYIAALRDPSQTSSSSPSSYRNASDLRDRALAFVPD